MLWIAAAGFLYTQRAALEPAVIEWSWQEPKPSNRPSELGRIEGRVTRLFAADSLQLRDDNGWLFNPCTAWRELSGSRRA